MSIALCDSVYIAETLPYQEVVKYGLYEVEKQIR